MNREDSIYRLRKELAYRESDGIEVSLLWNEPSDALFVVVHDRRVNELFELEVDASQALDAFHHPYAHAAFQGVDHRVAIRDARELSLSGC
jgi:hypothetical protein